MSKEWLSIVKWSVGLLGSVLALVTFQVFAWVGDTLSTYASIAAPLAVAAATVSLMAAVNKITPIDSTTKGN